MRGGSLIPPPTPTFRMREGLMTRSLASRVAQLERSTEAPRLQLVLVPDGSPMDDALRNLLNLHSGQA